MDASALDGLRTLVLSSTYEPLRIVSWKRAMILFLTEKTEVLDFYSSAMVRSVSRSFPLPSVIRMRRYAPTRRHRRGPRFSRLHVFLRDDHCCQYCRIRLPAKELTLDHIVPVVRGGLTTWSNIVSCCVPCNQRKGAKTPQEAGLVLAKIPAEPKPGFLPDLLLYDLGGQALERITNGKLAIPEPWKPYLPESFIEAKKAV